ncbi:hypothetical protein CXB49_17230 [Chromobacterium sp. ATCC 53434]|uniref:hypothetical protein n=1 Tax=Chromobacterium TaxID=535 RepID=UPI000C78BCB3|nr:hypothetical protein [Chromobacterium sp. ATCC 53434]AUH52413.1 hypothetical protein CXB49_17230 [Chromobacterium sp. ATCC 53434]
MAKYRKWIYACGAGGALLAAGCQAAPLPDSAGRAMLYAHGSAELGRNPQSGVGEAERLAQLRALVHGSAIHCGNPGCPFCNPGNRPPAPL